MKYRREIDGLRCLAVMPVVLFHAGLSVFPGGFAGVDVFFVISGFLITTILITEMHEDRFSIWRFYERRARRILPALCVVVLACIVPAIVWMSPEQFRDLGQSILAVGVFASNVLFWLETNYFTAAAEEKPLLHTWSLAVEEQYYILFPLILLLIWRWIPRQVLLLIAVMGLASFVWCLISIGAYPEFTFYMLPTRAWELLAGSLCAVIAIHYVPKARQDLALLGLGMVLGSMFLLNDHLPFPSAYTLFPVVGTALILLYARAGTLTAKILSWGPFVGIGLISYSLYLWHQPLMAFARVRSITPPSVEIMSLIALLSFGCVWITWRFVEQPFRPTGGVFKTRKTLLWSSAAVLSVCVGLGALMQSRTLDALRMGPDAIAMLENTPPGGQGNRCYNTPDAAGIKAGDLCHLGAPDAPIEFVVLGDSHASTLTNTLSDTLAAQGRAAVTINGGWCAPLLDFGTATHRKNPACRPRMNAAITRALSMDVPLILYAQWANYTAGGRWGDAGPTPFSFGDENNTDIRENPRQFQLALQATLKRIEAAGVPVVFVTSTPEYLFDVPAKALLLTRLGMDPEALRLAAPDYAQRNKDVTQVFNTVNWPASLIRIDATKLFCDPQGCLPVDDQGRPLFADSNHLNRLGAERLSKLLLAAVPVKK